MIVKLLNYTPDPERTCAAAALSSYWYKGASETLSTLSEKEIVDILKRVIGYGHHSVVEHASFTFSLEGVSRACTHQLVRHRIASYTQQSQRYVEMEESYIIPPSVEKKEKAENIFKNQIKSVFESYEKLVELGIPREDARFLLPNATKSNIVVTMNARELLHFFRLRCCNRSQWEIRKVAWKMLKEVKKIAPTIFEKAGPPCFSGTCPEGDLACNLWKEIKKKENRVDVMMNHFYVKYLKEK